MDNEFRSLRGTRDRLPAENVKWNYIQRVCREIFESYGYGEITTPVIERTELYTRSVGETTDIVQKEMYTFTLSGEESITLRPEGTAGTVRALLQNGMLNEVYPIKLKYFIPCFRHENPQAGRLRAFNQIGVEVFGAADFTQDAEIIAMLDDVMDSLGVTGVEIFINSIGCPVCRPAYRQLLTDYYTKYYDTLCEDCQGRLSTNPLRLLDCKQPQCQSIKVDAPRSAEHLCKDCDDHFTGLKDCLDLMGITYKINPEMVRGLDYYTRTVFEFVTNQIGSQGAICGGGRYDGLVEELGGPPTPGIGFGMGAERLLMVMEACGAQFPDAPRSALYIGAMGPDASKQALNIGYQLRKEGFYVLTDTMGDRSVRAQMKYADKQEVAYSCILGSNELEKGEVELNNMESGEKHIVKISPEAFAAFLWEQLEADLMGDPLDTDGLLGGLIAGNVDED